MVIGQSKIIKKSQHARGSFIDPPSIIAMDQDVIFYAVADL